MKRKLSTGDILRKIDRQLGASFRRTKTGGSLVEASSKEDALMELKRWIEERL